MNVCFDQLRKRKTRELPLIGNRDSSNHPQDELRLRLEKAINTLPDQQKACFQLFAVEGLKQTEIADIMGLSLGGVKSTIFNAKKRLRTLLSEDASGVNP